MFSVKTSKKIHLGIDETSLICIMVVMNETKTTLGDIFHAQLGVNFGVADKLRDLRLTAEGLSNYCKGEVEKDGDFAKVYADQIAERFDELAQLAEVALSTLLENKIER
jgi:hypothetical protein